MEYNIIAIDPSLISTALVVSSGDTFKIYNYCRENKVFGKKGITKWFGFAEEFITYKFIEYREYKDYSEGELVKLKDYDKISDTIITDILENIDPKKPTKIGIEGYSFSSAAGDIIDLVTFSTILRKKLFEYGYPIDGDYLFRTDREVLVPKKTGPNEFEGLNVEEYLMVEPIKLIARDKKEEVLDDKS